MARERKQFRRLAVAFVVLVVPAIVPTRAHAQNPDAVAPFVAMIRGAIGDAPTAGAGILLGVANDRLYIVTANHVVRQSARDAQRLEVQLKWLPGEWFPARLLEDSDTTLDLAVLAVLDAAKLNVPDLKWQALTRPDSLVAGSKVFPIGYPAGNPWFKTLQPHLVSVVSSNVIRAEGNLVPGHSGGALVTEDGGIVGLVSSVDALTGESQRIDRVTEKLTEWGYRVSLTWKSTAATPSPPATPGNPPVVPTGEVVTIRTSGSSRSYDFRSKTIGDGPTGGDFSLSGSYPAFYANNRGQRGVVDLGEVSGPIDKIDVPRSRYSVQNVNALVGHTYAALASEGHEGDAIVFRVLDIGYSAGKTEYYRIEYSYRTGSRPRPEMVIVPELVGIPVRDAQRRLEAAGLQMGPVERHALRKFASGTVSAQIPTAGAQINRGDSVKVYVDVTPPPEYQAAGSMPLTPTYVFDLDEDQTDRGRTSHDFRFGTENGWHLSPENGATIGEVRVPDGRPAMETCTRATLGRRPVPLTFRSPQMAFCVLTNRGRYSLLRVSRGQGADEIQVIYFTWKLASDR
jgi:Trypsin-like peptidase domain/PASTA domain